MQEKIYNEVRDKAYKSAFYILKEKNDADDIAQICTIKYFTNEQTVQNPLAWVAIVAKREAIKKAQNNNMLNLDTENLPDLTTMDSIPNLDKYTDEDYTEPKNLDVTPQEAKELLNKDDYIIYKLLLKYGRNINERATKLKISYNAASSRIYKAKRNLKAAKLLKIGYISTKGIVNYQLNKNIIKFLKILKEKMNSNDLKSLKKYFYNYDTEKIEKISIEKSFDYEIIKINDYAFGLCVPYINFEKDIQFLQVYLEIDNFNHIRIDKLYSFSSEIIKIKDKKENIIIKLPKSKKGVIPNKFSDVQKIIE